MANFGAYHLADNPTVYQPMRQNNFRFEVNFKDNPYLAEGLLKPGKHSGDEAAYITNGEEVIDFSVVSFDAPHFKQEEIPIKRGNSTIYFAGVPTFETGNLQINDFAGADGKSVLLAWQALSYDINTDTIPSSDHYKINGTVLEYLPDNTLVRHWELKNCWVTGISEDGWNAESGNKKTITATIRFDKAIPFVD